MSEETALKKIGFHQGFAFGLFLAVTCSAATYAAVVDWALNQETIVDILLAMSAIGAAALTIRSIGNQMQQERELIAEQVSRKLQADRALLGFALHDLHDIFLNASRQAIYPKKDYRLDWEKIVECCETIGKCVENADPASSKVLANLMSKAQYLTARHKEVLESNELLSSKKDCDDFRLGSLLVSKSEIAVQMQEFVLLCAAGFNYARLKIDTYETSEISSERVAASFSFLVCPRIESHKLWPKIQKAC